MPGQGEVNGVKYLFFVIKLLFLIMFHLQSDKEALLELYRRSQTIKSHQSSMASHLPPIAGASILIPTKKDSEVYDFIKMIVRKNLPLSVVDDNDYRVAFKHQHKFSSKLIRDVLFNLVPMVEEAITKEMKCAELGAIMHDGWSKFGTHYVALFAQYNCRTTTFIGKVKKVTINPASVLLAVRPMLNVPVTDEGKDESETEEDEEREEDEATSFTSEVHVKFFKDVFDSYGISLDEWAVCQVSMECLLYITLL